jgi:putative ABC transport system ATP-binding protein
MCDTPLVHVRDVHKHFTRGSERIDVLKGVTLDIPEGDFLALMGPSGSGKTTLLTALAGLNPPTSGSVLVTGTPLATDRSARRRLAIVLQGYGLVSLLTAQENIEVALRAQGRAPADAIAAATDALGRVGLEPFADHLVEQLSGGQAQRVAVARALAMRPDVLIADEPTAEQDADNRTRVLTEILAAADHGAAVIIATHDPEVAEVCDRIVTINAGRIVADQSQTAAMAGRDAPAMPGQLDDAGSGGDVGGPASGADASDRDADASDRGPDFGWR